MSAEALCDGWPFRVSEGPVSAGDAKPQPAPTVVLAKQQIY